MLGLSLAIRVGKRVLGGLIDSLMSAVKGRATYSENIADSKQVVKDIDNYELLDKASILLTPTAYSDARVHSVKTYTGDELVVNGGFDVDSDWSKSEGWDIVNGKATHDGLSSFKKISQLITTVIGNTYRYEVTVSNLTTSQVYLMARVGNEFGTIIFNNLRYDNGNYVFYFKALSTETAIVFQNGNSNAVSIDNSSVIDVSSDFDFVRASSATRINSDGLVQDMQSITDPELVLNGDFEELGSELVTNGDFSDGTNNWSVNANATGFIDTSNETLSYLTGHGDYAEVKQLNNSVVGKTYTGQFEVISKGTNADVFIQYGRTSIYTGSINSLDLGVHTFTVVSTHSDGFSISVRTNGEIEIDNVSVQQVDPNDRWTLGTGWSVEDGKLVGDGNMTASDTVNQAYNFTDGNTYKFSFEITERTQGSVFIREPFDGGSDAVGTVGTHTFNYVAGAANELRLRSDDNFTGKIDNISIKDITFSEDVDLARINYDSNGENGHWLLEPTSTNLVGYSLPNDTNWSKGSNTTITENYAVSPDGTQNASRLVMPSGSGTYAYYEFTATSTTNHTLSFYAKNNGGDADVTMAFFMASQTQSITLTNEWQRFEFTTSITSGNTVQVGVDNITSVDMLIFGVQCEALPYATSHIPTLTGSTVTRATETLNGSGNSTLINSTEGVLYAEIAAFENTNTDKNISISDGTPANRIGVYYYGNTMSAVGYLGGANQFYLAKAITDVKEFIKVAVKYKENDFALWIDGEQIATDTSGTVPSGLNSLQFDNGGGIGDFYGNCKALAVFDEALTDTELQNLTS